jgi:hypothetical protein
MPPQSHAVAMGNPCHFFLTIIYLLRKYKFPCQNHKVNHLYLPLSIVGLRTIQLENPAHANFQVWRSAAGGIIYCPGLAAGIGIEITSNL